MEKDKKQLSEKAVSQREFYYSKPFISLEIVKCAKNREMCFLGSAYNKIDNIRYINCALLDIFFKHIGIPTREEKSEKLKIADPYHFLSHEKNYNVYLSMAILDWTKCKIKSFSFAPAERKKQQEDFKKNIDKILVDIYGGFDFDGDQDFIWENKERKKISLDIPQEEAVNKALKDARVMTELLDEYKIEWHINFSGNRGFHIIYKVPLELPFLQKLDLINLIMERVAKTLNLKTLDTARFNPRKVLKSPYTLVTKDDVCRVVLPLDKNQMENFKLSETEARWVYQHLHFQNRGLFWRNQKVNKDEKISNFNRLLEDYEIKIPKERKWELN